jgi:hypothetical protein
MTAATTFRSEPDIVKPRSGGGRPPAYKLSNGQRVPSVTTITKRFADSGGLVRWANLQGLEGKSLDEERDAAADAGKLAHAWIEASIFCRPLERPHWATDKMCAQAKKALESFQDWAAEVRLDVLETEMPLVSEAHRFGGTMDCLAIVSGRLAILDWKSGKSIYGDFIVQQAGYHLLLEARGDAPLPERICILRIGKQYADFHYHSYGADVIELARRSFLMQRELYDLDKEFGKLL